MGTPSVFEPITYNSINIHVVKHYFGEKLMKFQRIEIRELQNPDQNPTISTGLRESSPEMEALAAQTDVIEQQLKDSGDIVEINIWNSEIKIVKEISFSSNEALERFETSLTTDPVQIAWENAKNNWFPQHHYTIRVEYSYPDSWTGSKREPNI